jgi:hypothetical protein
MCAAVACPALIGMLGSGEFASARGDLLLGLLVTLTGLSLPWMGWLSARNWFDEQKARPPEERISYEEYKQRLAGGGLYDREPPPLNPRDLGGQFLLLQSVVLAIGDWFVPPLVRELTAITLQARAAKENWLCPKCRHSNVSEIRFCGQCLRRRPS